MTPVKFMLLVAAVLVIAVATNANDSYEALDVDAISDTHAKELGPGNVDNGTASTKNNFRGRKFGGKFNNAATNEGFYQKKQTFMKMGDKEKGKKRKEDDDSGFVAFNVDYHAPRHHPPKNN